MTSGSYKSTPCPVRIRPSTPKASHERKIVPRLPRLLGRSNRAKSGVGERRNSSKLSLRILPMANSSLVSSLPLSSRIRESGSS